MEDNRIITKHYFIAELKNIQELLVNIDLEVTGQEKAEQYKDIENAAQTIPELIDMLDRV